MNIDLPSECHFNHPTFIQSASECGLLCTTAGRILIIKRIYHTKAKHVGKGCRFFRRYRNHNPRMPRKFGFAYWWMPFSICHEDEYAQGIMRESWCDTKHRREVCGVSGIQLFWHVLLTPSLLNIKFPLS